MRWRTGATKQKTKIYATSGVVAATALAAVAAAAAAFVGECVYVTSGQRHDRFKDKLLLHPCALVRFIRQTNDKLPSILVVAFAFFY